MDFNKIKLFLNTIIYLKPTQVFYRIYYMFFRNFLKNNNVRKKYYHSNLINWKTFHKHPNYYSAFDNSFDFLNIKHTFNDTIDWNYLKYGMLWLYNLNYFDFLCQSSISKKNGLKLIHKFIKFEKKITFGNDPYPISLRAINWIKFLSENNYKEQIIDNFLFDQYKVLIKNLEYNLLGNHLLENSFSLLFGAYYFQNNELYKKSKKLLIKQLDEQILTDGGHYELSPMYHQLILFRLLDAVNLIRLNPFWKNDNLLFHLECKAKLMQSWLKNITYKSGEIPMVNDSTYNIAPKSSQLFKYFNYLKINNKRISLSESGYRKINMGIYELFLDVGNIGPDYQPGHAHSDTFNFELVINSVPIFVDSGISTYEKNSKRHIERSTESHNTVKIGSKNQSEVWGSFRVGKRARIIFIEENKNSITATHDGYKSIGFLHTRTFNYKKNKIIIEDSINKSTNGNSKAFFNISSKILRPKILKNSIVFDDLHLTMNFENFSNIKIIDCKLSAGFNKSVKGYRIVVSFDKNLITTLIF